VHRRWRAASSCAAKYRGAHREGQRPLRGRATRSLPSRIRFTCGVFTPAYPEKKAIQHALETRAPKAGSSRRAATTQTAHNKKTSDSERLWVDYGFELCTPGPSADLFEPHPHKGEGPLNRRPPPLLQVLPQTQTQTHLRHIPDKDNAVGSTSNRRVRGRRDAIRTPLMWTHEQRFSGLCGRSSTNQPEPRS
jgi:hypothetical protein